MRLLGGVVAAGVTRAYASVAAPAVEIIKQSDSGGECGPLAVCNALLNGDAAGRRAFRKLPGTNAKSHADALIQRYGSKPSETYGSRRGRFLSGAGLTCEDMPFFANDFLAENALPAVRGLWLDRRAQEDGPAHLRRLHGWLSASLAQGMPPVMEVRAFAADTAASAKPAWVNLYAHWLALIGLEPLNLGAGASGFLCRFADSYSGRVISGFAHVELNRPFMATRGFTLKSDGSQEWHWLSGEPYILLEVPDLPLLLQTRPWQNRSVVALTYMVARAAV